MRTLFGLCLALAIATQAPSSQTAPGPSPSATTSLEAAQAHLTDQRLKDLPIDFRCDNMVIKTEPNRNICQGHVVLRRGTMVVCCNTFEGVADARWLWQRFVCTGDVRAARDVETAWADKAEFFVADNDLVLTGGPVLHRGDSLLEGERITMNMQENYARVVRPRGRMGAQGATPLGRQPVPIPTGSLPRACPIPPLGSH